MPEMRGRRGREGGTAVNGSGRTRKFLINSVTAALGEVVLFLAGIVTPRVILACYGSEINGLVTSITQIVSYFTLVEAGLAGAAVYALYKPLADSDQAGISRIVSATKRFYTRSGLIFTALTVVAAVAYPLYIRTEHLSMEEVGVLVLILGMNGALDFFTLGKYRALLTADQKLYVLSLGSIVHQIIYTLIVCVFAKQGVSIVILRLIAVSSITVRSLILAIYCRKRYPWINYRAEPNFKALDKRWSAFYLQILGVIQSSAPVLILTLVLRDLKLISVYSVYNMVVSGVGSVTGIFSSGLSSSFGDVIARKEQAVLQKAYREFEFAFYSVITVLYSIAAATILPFISIYTKGITDAEYHLPITAMLFVINGFLYNFKTPQGMLVISAGLYKETRGQTTTQGAIALIGGLILAPSAGLNGVLAAVILSNLYRTIDLLFFIPKHVTKLPVKSTAIRLLRMCVLFTLIVTPVRLLTIPVQGYFQWVVFACAVAIYAILLTLLFAWLFEREELKNLMKRLRSLRR